MEETSSGSGAARSKRGGGLMRGERKGKGGVTIPADTEDEVILGDGAVRQYVKMVKEGEAETFKVNVDGDDLPVKLKGLIQDWFLGDQMNPKSGVIYPILL